MIDYDVAKKPGRPSEWTALVAAICASTESVESVWLECKTVNWTTGAGVGNIARAILGMANRPADRAAPFVGGSGLVLVGLNDKTHAIESVEVIDPTDLENKLTPYLGADGPRWEARWIKVYDHDLLLIEVDPPAAGDPGYILRKGYGGEHKASQTFVREGSKTVPASQADVIRLGQRLTATTAKETLDVLVGPALDGPMPRVASSEDDAEAFLGRERDRLLAFLDNPRRRPDDPAGTFEGFASQHGITAAISAFRNPLGIGGDQWHDEDRSPDQYREEVEAYIDTVRERMGHYLATILRRVVPVSRFWISNLSERNFRDVEVTIRVEGEAMAHKPDPDEGTSLRPMLPRRPRRFGAYSTPSPSSMISSLGGMARFAQSAPYIPNIGPIARGDIRNGGSFEVDFDTLSLRPSEARVPLEPEPVILIPVLRADPVVVHWHATASNVDAVADGVFELPFDAPAVDPLVLGLADEPR